MSTKILKNKSKNKPRFLENVAAHEITLLKNEAFSGNQYAIERLVDIAEECSRAIEWIWEGYNFPIGVDHIKEREFNRSKIKIISRTRSDWPILYHSFPKERKMVTDIINKLELEKNKHIVQRASSDEYGILLLNILLSEVGEWVGKDLKEYSKKAARKLIAEFSDVLYGKNTWLGQMLFDELNIIDKRNFNKANRTYERNRSSATIIQELNNDTKRKEKLGAFESNTLTAANHEKVIADVIFRKLTVNESKAARL